MKNLQSDNLARAIKARQDFINALDGKRKEQALELQKVIANKLKSAGYVHNRLVLIQQMMFDKLMELEPELKNLKEKLIEGKIKEIKYLKEQSCRS